MLRRVSSEDLPRRLRAARALAGYSTVEALARALDEPGLGARTLRAIEQSKRDPAPRDLRVIADACGVSIEFLTGPDDLVRHPAPGSEPIPDASLARAVERLYAMLDERAERVSEDVLKRIGEAQRFIDRQNAERVGEAMRELLTRFDRVEDLLHAGQDRRDALAELADAATSPDHESGDGEREPEPAEPERRRRPRRRGA